MYMLKVIRTTINLSNFIRIQFYLLQHIRTTLKVIRIELLFSLMRHSYFHTL
ncbi:hypothetical protein GIB67_013179 [Kingdonia uniflora]|uniref:Uncharacterized protein n=1 Tax=Kingdonia uniflora TaxID=39325 RepID=A0A7J7LD03_9MAGN|nr:hypothetical protein GIB67_013179 [Kingdonia uniflora]